ncbi:MAG: hypothetical protein KIT27_05500 [Legionellales bacterium]|nr:hypothetical protein [Legionellales bacterium]
MNSLDILHQKHNPCYFFATTCLKHYGINDYSACEELATIIHRYVQWFSHTINSTTTELESVALCEQKHLQPTNLSDFTLNRPHEAIASNE